MEKRDVQCILCAYLPVPVDEDGPAGARQGPIEASIDAHFIMGIKTPVTKLKIVQARNF